MLKNGPHGPIADNYPPEWHFAPRYSSSWVLASSAIWQSVGPIIIIRCIAYICSWWKSSRGTYIYLCFHPASSLLFAFIIHKSVHHLHCILSPIFCHKSEDGDIQLHLYGNFFFLSPLNLCCRCAFKSLATISSTFSENIFEQNYFGKMNFE